ncbi:MAG TPA: hypothetical protein PK668_26790 [Myxococcota bacterium]|nr:hypothetical protein [Myxococcota bacterium]HRY97137.1 hypothetical protein [Myxococcota bacterium]HSA24694.1 hypothetical protein [Myxococcota bacterium]
MSTPSPDEQGCCAPQGDQADCGCCGAPPAKRGPNLKALISTLVIAAALAVGAYSLWAADAQPPAAAPAPVVTSQPAVAPGAPAAEAPPACGCRGQGPVEATEAGSAMPAEAPPACGAPKPGCCGH